MPSCRIKQAQGALLKEAEELGAADARKEKKEKKEKEGK